MGDLTTIPINKATRDKLKSFGKKGETYDQIVRRLMESVDYVRFMERQYEILDDKSSFVKLDEID